jgi:hypoxanthine-guanine phosphoribosyltransferase
MHELESRWPTREENPFLIEQLLTEKEVNQQIDLLAVDIFEGQRHKNPLIVSVHEGGRYITERLERTWNKYMPDFEHQATDVRTQRIYDDDHPTGFELLRDVPSPILIEGRTVIITEDILDTGVSLRDLVRHFICRGASEVIIAVLIKRSGNHTDDNIPEAKYICFTINTDAFFIGSGLDDKRMLVGDSETLASGLANDGGRSWPGIWTNHPPKFN